jgi:hypothetical protein
MLGIITVFAVPSTPTYAQLEDVVARVRSAVVLVQFRNALGEEGHGSGFTYDSGGFILTNHHVVEGATDIAVKVPDGRSFKASVVDYLRREQYAGPEMQSDVDVAVLKIDATNLPFLPLGDSSTLRQGQELLVLGYPGGVGTEQASVTRGIVSAVRTGWIQTDASLESGNSGGPVLDRQGRVVGLATFVTGRLRKIGGVVAVNSIRDIAMSALDSRATRQKTIAMPGYDYVSPTVLPRTRVWRENYNPGSAKAQPYSHEYTIDVTNVQEINGAYIFTLQQTEGSNFKYYLDTGGLVLLSRLDSNWIYALNQPLLMFPLPPIARSPWRNEFSFENPSSETRVRTTSESRIDADDETYSVAAGRFLHVIKVVTIEERLITRGTQAVLYHATTISWRAPAIGPIRAVTDVAETGEHIVQELVSTR